MPSTSTKILMFLKTVLYYLLLWSVLNIESMLKKSARFGANLDDVLYKIDNKPYRILNFETFLKLHFIYFIILVCDLK